MKRRNTAAVVALMVLALSGASAHERKPYEATFSGRNIVAGLGDLVEVRPDGTRLPVGVLTVVAFEDGTVTSNGETLDGSWFQLTVDFDSYRGPLDEGSLEFSPGYTSAALRVPLGSLGEASVVFTASALPGPHGYGIQGASYSSDGDVHSHGMNVGGIGWRATVSGTVGTYEIGNELFDDGLIGPIGLGETETDTKTGS